MISFPKEVYKEDDKGDFNPSIRLFGRRFTNDQQMLDYVAEFFLVAASPKIVFTKFDEFLPSMSDLIRWREEAKALRYMPKAHLNLKLFAFLGASPLARRDAVHRDHAIDLRDRLIKKIEVESSASSERAFMRCLESLFLGFWGTGGSRTWCAQTFVPFSKALLCSEVIWNAKAAKRENATNWNDILDNFKTHFGLDQHVVYCRGGEALYLQVCNALTQSPLEIKEWMEESQAEGVQPSLSVDEQNPERLRDLLISSFKSFFGQTPPALERIADIIDSGVDSDTQMRTDFSSQDIDSPREMKCGWVPQAGWRDGYLFAVELSRILSCSLDVMSKIEMVEICCVLQILRSVLAQTYRNSQTEKLRSSAVSDYRLLLCDPSTRSRKSIRYSVESLAEVSREVQQVIRTSEMAEIVKEYVARKETSDIAQNKRTRKIFQDADDYGYKLLRKLGKSIGLIVPPRGGNMKCTLNEKILRYLVLSLVPGQRMTLDTFKEQIKAHHGFVFELKGLAYSRNWTNRIEELIGGDSDEAWLERMLEASGMLIRLSDACSLVCNPFASEERNA